MATDTALGVIGIAARELGIEESTLNPETRLDDIFTDSLEYIDFTVKLQELGHLSDESIANAETLGDLADAIVYPD